MIGLARMMSYGSEEGYLYVLIFAWFLTVNTLAGLTLVRAIEDKEKNRREIEVFLTFDFWLFFVVEVYKIKLYWSGHNGRNRVYIFIFIFIFIFFNVPQYHVHNSWTTLDFFSFPLILFMTIASNSTLATRSTFN